MGQLSSLQNTISTLAKATIATRELNQKTRAAHTRIEQAPLLQRLLEPSLTQPLFLQTQFRFLQVYQPLEISLMSMGFWTADIPVPDRCSSLTRDIIMMGSQAPEIFTNVPTPKSHAWALGRAYVLEGSRLGGEVIRRKLERLPWFRESYGSFFTPDQGRWHRFKDLLNHYLTSPRDINDAILGANEGFNLIDMWMRNE